MTIEVMQFDIRHLDVFDWQNSQVMINMAGCRYYKINWQLCCIFYAIGIASVIKTYTGV
jgi:hypothetical protein